MSVFITVKLQVEGIHKWEGLSDILKNNPSHTLQAVNFLTNYHRHIFHITVVKQVSHSDRDIEIILFKQQIKDALTAKFYDKDYNCLNFTTMSCENIASHILNFFQASVVTVLEDDENGAIVTDDN